MPTLAPSGLTDEQRQHFADHGWLLLEDVLDPRQCQTYVDIIDYTMERFEPATIDDEDKFSRGNRRDYFEPHLLDLRFVEVYEAPGLLEAVTQLVGDPDVRYHSSIVVSTQPDHESESERELLTDASKWGWHRDLQPRDNISAADDDPRFINAMVLSVATYFTPVSAEDGVTAFFDGSHQINGKLSGRDGDIYTDLEDRCAIVQPAAGPGSMVIFSESTVHTATHVLSDRRRVALFSWFGAHWTAPHDDWRPPHMSGSYSNERLRRLFKRPGSGP